LSDLQPYICTYTDCQLHEYFFDNREDWFHHESRTHRMEWFCNTEPHQSFVDNQDFLDHMQHVHSESLTGNQLLSIHRGFQRPSNMVSGICTLCGEHANNLKSHLARHLEQLALFAIPQTDYMPDLNENDTSSNAVRQGAPGSSGLISTDEQPDVSSRVPSPELSERMKDDSEDKNLQHTDVLKDLVSVPDIPDHLEGGIDTSWDHVTSKFKNARDATFDEQMKHHHPTRLSDVSEHTFEESDQASRREIRSTYNASVFDNNDLNPISPESPPRPDIPPASKPQLSLRQRAGRVSSTLLAPFRASSKPTDVVRPESADQIRQRWNEGLRDKEPTELPPPSELTPRRLEATKTFRGPGPLSDSKKGKQRSWRQNLSGLIDGSRRSKSRRAEPPEPTKDRVITQTPSGEPRSTATTEAIERVRRLRRQVLSARSDAGLEQDPGLDPEDRIEQNFERIEQNFQRDNEPPLWAVAG